MRMRHTILLVFLITSAVHSQNFWVSLSQNQESIGAEHLSPPNTAGADYANNIILESIAYVSLTGIEEDLPWCLFAQRINNMSGVAPLTLKVDYSELNPQQWGSNSPIKCVLSQIPNPCFSGVGPIEYLPINFQLENASVANDWELRTDEILWTVKTIGCPKQ